MIISEPYLTIQDFCNNTRCVLTSFIRNLDVTHPSPHGLGLRVDKQLFDNSDPRLTEYHENCVEGRLELRGIRKGGIGDGKDGTLECGHDVGKSDISGPRSTCSRRQRFLPRNAILKTTRLSPQFIRFTITWRFVLLAGLLMH